MNKKNYFLISVLILAIVSISFTNSFAQEKTKPPMSEKKEFTIQGNVDWQNTGIRLKPKDKVTITARGTVYFSNADNDSGASPNGWTGNYREDWPNDFLQCDDPIPSVNHAALIANVGNDDFVIGQNKTFTGKDGVLYLGINDCSFKGNYYNSGSFKGVITVQRFKVER